MTLRHASALALAGWYLMMPPNVQATGKPQKPDYDAPLSAWRIVRRFDSVVACDKALDAVHRSEDSSRCIAAGDPRLNQNKSFGFSNSHS